MSIHLFNSVFNKAPIHNYGRLRVPKHQFSNLIVMIQHCLDNSKKDGLSHIILIFLTDMSDQKITLKDFQCNLYTEQAKANSGEEKLFLNRRLGRKKPPETGLVRATISHEQLGSERTDNRRQKQMKIVLQDKQEGL